MYVWYPPGLLTAWLTGYALAGIGAAMLLLGGPEGMHERCATCSAQVLDRLYPAAGVEPRRCRLRPSLRSFRGSSRRHGWLPRSSTPRWRRACSPGLPRTGVQSPSLVALDLPIWLHIALGITAAAAVFGGAAGFVGINAMIALSVAFCLGGLAVLHAAARRLSHPTMVLVFFYTMAALFGWPFLAVGRSGTARVWLGLRRRLAPQE